MWPTALANLGLDLKGKISAGAEPGRAVARLTDLGHGQALRALFREDTPDGPVPPGLAQAVMDVMKDWAPEWTSRPDAIVVVESATRPTLTARPGRRPVPRMQVPIVGTWAIRDDSVPPRAGQSNSAQRVAAVRRRGGLDADVPPGATVLLVDDQVATGLVRHRVAPVCPAARPAPRDASPLWLGSRSRARRGRSARADAARRAAPSRRARRERSVAVPERGPAPGPVAAPASAAGPQRTAGRPPSVREEGAVWSAAGAQWVSDPSSRPGRPGRPSCGAGRRPG